MNRKLNQILIKSIKNSQLKVKNCGMWFLIFNFTFLIFNCLYAANPDSIQMTVRPNFGPPTSVTDLAATIGAVTGEININWTAAAEDPDPWFGTLILDYPYRVRYSTNSLSDLAGDTTAWWNQANTDLPYLNQLPNNPPGFSESAVLTFDTWYYGKVVYLGIRAQDSGNYLSQNISTASATVKPPITDIIPPAAISDLTALAGNYEGEIVLQWTSPGDDGTIGSLVGTGQFVIKYAQEIITKDNFDLIGTTISIGVTATPGSQQTLGPLQFSEGTNYWFAIKAKDDNELLSVWNSTADVSNVNTKAFCQSAVDDDTPAPVT
ncbi:MAG: hypothetical protein Q7K21_03675, partial [Elusimicrobiota bacterium]|nr:hypothetical protein [Elusimicrobiota bacterium]